MTGVVGGATGDALTADRAVRREIGCQRVVFRPEIEGLRAIAVGVVLAFHAGIPGFGGGYAGVDVFFVLSGYLITWLLVAERSSTGRVSLGGFYARRARRLLPAMFLMLSIVSIVAAFLYAPLEQRFVVNTAIASLLYVSNLYLAHVSTDYLHAPVDVNPLLHTWSLGVEEQFYMLWPLMLGLAFMLGTRFGTRRLLIAALAVVAAASLATSVALTAYSQPTAFFVPFTRAWEFAGGAACTFLLHVRNGRGRATARAFVANDSMRSALAWIGLAGLVGTTVTFDKTTPFPGYHALLPVLSTMALIVGAQAGAQRPPFVHRLLASAPMQFVGSLSYTLYLWHWPLLVFATVIGIAPTPLPRLAVLGVALVLSWLSHRFLEGPVRAIPIGPGLAWLRWMTVFVLLGLLLLVPAGWWRAATLEWASAPAQQRFTQARDDLADIYATGCHVAFSVRAPGSLDHCTERFGDSGRVIMLIGDSHAAQWYPAWKSIAKRHGDTLIALTKSACPAIDELVQLEGFNRPYVECADWHAATLETVRETKPNLVVMSSSAHYAISTAAWRNGTASLVDALRSTGAGVLIMGPTPEMSFDVPACLARQAWATRFTGVDLCRPGVPSESLLAIAAQLRAIAGGRANVRYIDSLDLICPDGSCRVEQGGLVMFRDADHLTARYARSLAPMIDQRMRQPGSADVAGEAGRR